MAKRARLDDKLTLEGLTRRSSLDLAKERLSEELEIVERKFAIGELIGAEAENRLLESFSAGIAASY